MLVTRGSSVVSVFFAEQRAKAIVVSVDTDYMMRKWDLATGQVIST